MSNFPHCMETGIERERSLWVLADAILAETDKSRNGPHGLKACAAELAQHGHSYTPRELRRFRQVAESFPAERRHSDVSFSVHVAAKNPDMLDVIVKWCRKQGRCVTVRVVKDVIRGWRLSNA